MRSSSTSTPRRTFSLAILGMAALYCCLPARAAEPAPETVAAARIPVQRGAELPKQTFPWGSISWLMNAEMEPRAAMTFGVVELKPHQSNPLHVHPNSEEILYVVSGSCEHRIGDQWDTLRAGDLIRIPPGAPDMARTLEEPVQVIVVYDTGTRQFVPVEEDGH